MNRKPPNPQQLLAWLNSHLPASIQPIDTLKALASSTAYLFLLFKFNPSISMQEVIIDPTEQFEVIHNFKLLAVALQKMGLQFAFSISKLAEGSHRQNLRLMQLFYNNFSEIKHLKEETAEASLSVSVSKGVKISAPQMPIYPVLSKQKKFEVTEDELNELQQPKDKLKTLEAPVQFQRQPSPSRFQINNSEDFNKTSQVNSTKNLIIPQEQQWPNEQPFTQKNANNEIFFKYNNTKLNKVLGKITFEFVNECEQTEKCRSKMEQLMKKFSKIFLRAGSLSYIFTGFIGGAKKIQQDSNQQIQQFAETRETIRRLCEDFYQSNEFIKRIIMAQVNIKSKIRIIRNLKQIWQFSQLNRTDFAHSMIAQQPHKQQKSFFSKHRKALIIYQLQYINNKDYPPDTTQWKQFNNISTSTGLLLRGLLGGRSINVSDLIKQSKKHVNLNNLFDQTKDHSLQQVRLREFIRLMLELKHTRLVDQFIEIYEIIVENILCFTSLKTQSDLFQATESIMVQLTNYGKRLKDYCMKQFELKNSLQQMTKLLKVTVFCLLAEKNQFNANPYFSDLIAKKSIQKTYHCNEKAELIAKTFDVKHLNIQSSQELINSYVLSKCKQYSQSQNNSISTSIVKLITSWIKDNLLKLGCHKQIEYILLKCASHKHAFSLLQYIFFGRNIIILNGNQQFYYDKNMQSSQPFLKARNTIRRLALKYIISSSFLRRILRFINRKIEIKFNYLRLLPVMQQLPKIPIKKQQFFSSIQPKLKRPKISNKKKQVGKRVKINNNKATKTLSFSRQSFWSEHKTVLVGMQILYIKKKVEHQNHHKGKLNYSKGFLLDSTQKESTEIELKVPQQIKKYSHLNNLFQNNNLAPQLQSLRSVVKTMLQIKHEIVIPVFLKIYNIIVRQLVKKQFRKVRLHSNRFKLIDTIVQRLQKCGDVLDGLLKDSYGLKEDPTETKLFLRVTVYCFLAEMHSFSINEFYSQVFDNKTVGIFGYTETQE